MKYFFPLIFLGVLPVAAQFNTTLQPETVAQFDQYASKVERQPSSISQNASERQSALNGQMLIRPGTPDNPISVFDGLIHDWDGAIFVPHTTMQKVLGVLQDFDHHSRIYPHIVSSRLIRRDGNNVVGYWRVEWKYSPVTVVLDIEEDAEYREIAPGHWICHAYAKHISEVENAGTEREKKLPPGSGKGFLWRMYAYWDLQTVDGGVLAECRTLSLSRSIPPMLAWAIKPFVQKLPRESLAGTLRETAKAAAK